MRYIAKLLLLFTIIITAENSSAQTENTYDSVLAKKLQADDYGMKSYVLVILKKGSVALTDSAQRNTIFRGHMANINKLANEHKLVVAGPTGENEKNYEGIFIFNTADINEAKSWLGTDPAINSKALEGELYSFYCSAALMEVSALHSKIAKIRF
jgi:uncharacterized protein